MTVNITNATGYIDPAGILDNTRSYYDGNSNAINIFDGDSQFKWVAAHEFAHTLNLPDRYKGSIPINSSWVGMLMGQRGGGLDNRKIGQFLLTQLKINHGVAQ